MFKEAYSEIIKAQRIIIHRHKNPDGDALGSQMGLYHIIRATFPEKEVYVVGDFSRRYAFIAPSGMDTVDDSLYDGALAIILDTSGKELISDERYKKASTIVRFDHHLFVEKIADVEVYETSYESCCGIITDFAIETDMVVNSSAATALFSGTVTDSGRFRYDCTTGETFRRVRFLLSKGADAQSVYTKLYTDSIGSLKRKAYFMQKAIFEDGVGYFYCTKEELKKLGMSAFDAARGQVNTMADLEGVYAWVAFAEAEEGVLCELRSSGPNINPIAVKYGGGGHKKASGATVKDKKTAMAMLEDLKKIAGEYEQEH